MFICTRNCEKVTRYCSLYQVYSVLKWWKQEQLYELLVIAMFLFILVSWISLYLIWWWVCNSCYTDFSENGSNVSRPVIEYAPHNLGGQCMTGVQSSPFVPWAHTRCFCQQHYGSVQALAFSELFFWSRENEWSEGNITGFRATHCVKCFTTSSSSSEDENQMSLRNFMIILSFFFFFLLFCNILYFWKQWDKKYQELYPLIVPCFVVLIRLLEFLSYLYMFYFCSKHYH